MLQRRRKRRLPIKEKIGEDYLLPLFKQAIEKRNEAIKYLKSISYRENYGWIKLCSKFKIFHGRLKIYT